jgi:hypothetical protein
MISYRSFRAAGLVAASNEKSSSRLTHRLPGATSALAH